MIYYLNDYEYTSVVYINLASFNLQCHKLVRFGEQNVFPCHFDVFEQQSPSLDICKRYFAKVHEAFQCDFECHVDF